MNKKIITKLAAMALAFILTFANFTIIGSYTIESLATSINLEAQNTKVDKANIEFDAYFLNEGEIKHSKEIGVESNEKIYLKIKATDGYLANGTIKMKNANFNVQSLEKSSGYIQSIDSETNTIILNQIDKGESVILEIPITMNADSNFAIQNIDKITEVTLNGVYVDNKAEEKSISKTINVNAKLTSEAKANIEEEVTKFVQYYVGGKKRLALELTIKSNVEKNILPVKKTELEIEIPKINNIIEPKEVAVSAKSLYATNGIGTKNFANTDYTYGSGKINLFLINEEKDGYVSWMKNAQDEIVVTCIYEIPETLNSVTLETKARNKIFLYDSNNTNVSMNIGKTQTYSEKIGEVITSSVSTDVSKLHKGYMLVTGANDTKYVENISLNISDKDVVDNIVLDTATYYLDEGNNMFFANQKYINTKIDKDNFINLFGENGYINIYDNQGGYVFTLNKNNLEYTYQKEITKLRIQTSKPITEGILNIQNERAIKPLEYDKAKEATISKMNIVLTGTVLFGSTQTELGQGKTEIVFDNPSEQASLELNRNNLSTVVTNEDVEIRATLKTTDASTVLYKNPSIELVFPKYITGINIKKISLVYDEQLVISNTKISKNDNGNIVLTALLSGEQTAFNKEALVEGATIVIESNITVDELTPTKTENIIMNIKNEATNKTITEALAVNFVAPVGMTTINQILNFEDNGGVATSISGKTETGDLKIESNAKTATVKMTVINNCKSECKNVVILGRTPYEGNEIGSTFTAKMLSGIKNETNEIEGKFKVYYSENGEATKDLTNAQNGWSEVVSDLSKVKSYMIVFNNYSLAIGDTICFSYNVEIPAGLTYDNSAYETFSVYYNKIEGNRLTEVVKAAVCGVTTGQGPDLNVELISNVEDKSELEEGQMITYTAKITNNKNRGQDGVSLVLQLSDNVYYRSNLGTITRNGNIQEVTIPIGTMNANEVKTIVFKVEVGMFTQTKPTNNNAGIKYYDENGNEIEKPDDDFKTDLTLEDFNNDEEKYNEYKKAVEEYLANQEQIQKLLGYDINTNKIIVKALVKVEGFTKIVESNENVNTIIKKDTEAWLMLNVNTAYDTELRVGNMIEFGLSIRKNLSKSFTNVTIKCNIPDGLKFYEATEGGVYDEKTKTVTWTFDKMNSAKSIVLRCSVEDLPKGVYERSIPLKFTAKCNENEKTFTSGSFMVKVVKEAFAISQTSNISDGKVSVGDEITYAITVKNLGTISAAATITDYLPNGFKFMSYNYTQNGGVTTRSNNTGSAVNIPVVLDAGETLTIYLKAKVTSDVDSDNLTNKITLNSSDVKGLNVDELTLNIDNNKTNGTKSNNNESGDEAVTKTTYRVSGAVWIDINKNGQKDGEEELKPDVDVLLIDSQKNIVVSRTKTNESGIYTFDNIEKAQYVVAFGYDTLEYDVTTYQAQGIDWSINSDAINMLLNIDNKIKKYAATNTIFVSSNVYNIDLGLVISKKFDLEITKSVSFIQTSNAKGTESYMFDKVDVAKVEIPEKEIEGTVIAITYTFTIENKGAVAGYVNKIVDYIPADLSFTSSLNPEWYQDTDGNLYNISLANRMINPEEKVELSLILTKTMTGENTGVVNNSAEICEVSNDYGISDLDSTPGNRAAVEDDYDIADIIITVKTGGPVYYVGIAIAIFAIFAVGTYIIKRKVLPRI